MPPVSPSFTAPAVYVPPAVSGTGDGGTKVAGKRWWQIDRKIWTGGLASGAAFTIVSYIKVWTGFDLNVLNPMLDSVLSLVTPGVHMDITALFGIIIGGAIAQYVPPSFKDRLAWLNEMVIRAANADPTNPVKAMIVNDHASNAAAENDIAAGVIPDDIIDKRDT